MTRAIAEAVWNLNTAQNGVVKICVYTGTKTLIFPSFARSRWVTRLTARFNRRPPLGAWHWGNC